VIIGIVAIACNASGALSVDEQVKMLGERYRQVEDQLAHSIRYTSKDESGGATIIRQEWYNGAEDLVKAAVDEILKMRRLPNN
jgi:predicted glycosyltransferase